MPGSYVNFYVANGGVVMMGFGDEPRDAAAKAKLIELFPQRRVVMLPGREILLGGGGFHCITQQQQVCLPSVASFIYFRAPVLRVAKIANPDGACLAATWYSALMRVSVPPRADPPAVWLTTTTIST